MRRPILAFAISALILLFTESTYPAQRGTAGTPAAKPEARGAAVKRAPVPPVKIKKTAGRVATRAALSPVQQKLQRNPGLAAKIGAKLPPGTNLLDAASGFQTVGQFVAAVNGSNSSRIPFVELKRRMAFDGMSLSQAIQDLRPKSDYRSQAQRAETEAAALIGTEEVAAPPMARAQRTPH
jgi:hypothetical protein